MMKLQFKSCWAKLGALALGILALKLIFTVCQEVATLREMKSIFLIQQHIKEFGLTEEEQKIFKMLLENLVGVARDENIEIFLSGGALLGYYRYGGPLPWDDDLDVLVAEEDMPKLMEAFKSLGGGLSSIRAEGSYMAKFFSTVNYTENFDDRYVHNFPFIDAFAYSRHGQYIYSYHKTKYVDLDSVFPLDYVEYMGVAGLGVPRDAAAYLATLYGRRALEECAKGRWDHRTESFYAGERPRIPCKKLDLWLDLKPRLTSG